MWGVIIRPDALKGDVRSFYEIAATLIPLLVFGGVVTERVIPPKGRWKALHFGAAVWAVPASGFYAIFAEILAINAVVTGEADVLTRYVVSGAIVGGMLAVVCSIWLPWLAGAKEESREPLSSLTKWGIGLVIAGVGFISFFQLAEAVDVAGTTEREREFRAAIQKNLEEEAAVQERIAREQARAEGLHQEAVQAAKHHEARSFFVVLAAQRRLEKLILLDFKQETRLILERANLYREMVGLPALKRLTPKIPLKDAAREERRKGNGAGAASGP